MNNLHIKIDTRSIQVPEGSSVAVAILSEGQSGFRTSVTGQPRGPVCGMGICYECRVTIDGNPHQRSCMILCREGMEVITG